MLRCAAQIPPLQEWNTHSPQLLWVLVIDGSHLSLSLGIALERQAKESYLAQGHTVSLQSAHIQWLVKVRYKAGVVVMQGRTALKGHLSSRVPRGTKFLFNSFLCPMLLSSLPDKYWLESTFQYTSCTQIVSEFASWGIHPKIIRPKHGAPPMTGIGSEMGAWLNSG